MRALLAGLLTVGLAWAQFVPYPGPGRAPAGAAETTLSVVKLAGSYGESSGTTIIASLNNVTSGNAILCAVWSQTHSATVTAEDHDSNALSLELESAQAVGAAGRFSWLLLGWSASGNRTITATYSESASYRAINCYELEYSGGTITVDQHSRNASAGMTLNITTGSITTTAKGLSMALWIGTNFGGTPSVTRTINGETGTNADVTYGIYSWYKSFDAPYSAGQGAATAGTAWWNAMIAHWVVTP